MEYFEGHKHHNHDKFYKMFCTLLEHLDSDSGVDQFLDRLLQDMHTYDYDEFTPANGYRSIIKVLHKCCVHILVLCRYISVNKGSFLFRCGHYSRELSAYVNCLGQIRAAMFYAVKLMGYCEVGELFSDDNKFRGNETAERLMAESECIDAQYFYGRCLGFQYCESMLRPFQVLHITMAVYSELYKQDKSKLGKLTGSILSGGKYLLNPDLRGKQVSVTTKTEDIRFCKGFWGLAETQMMHTLPDYVCPSVQVNEVLLIPAKAVDIPKSQSIGHVTIHPPQSHHGPGPVQVRLISQVYREGQELLLPYLKDQKGGKFVNNRKVQPKSPYLLIQCHGGGFVAQSSKSHETYLREWACDLKVPLVAIDYSLAPDSPYPRAIEECFFAYAWILQNCHILGSTGEKICLVGDSAGGNLILSTALWAGEIGIRVPDGLVGAYGCFMVRYSPSPSRILSIMDPLIPVGMLTRVLGAYVGVTEEEILASQKSASDLLKKSKDGREPEPAEEPLLQPQDEPQSQSCSKSLHGTEKDSSNKGAQIRIESKNQIADNGKIALHRLCGPTVVDVDKKSGQEDLGAPHLTGAPDLTLEKLKVHTSCKIDSPHRKRLLSEVVENEELEETTPELTLTEDEMASDVKTKTGNEKRMFDIDLGDLKIEDVKTSENVSPFVRKTSLDSLGDPVDFYSCSSGSDFSVGSPSSNPRTTSHNTPSIPGVHVTGQSAPTSGKSEGFGDLKVTFSKAKNTVTLPPKSLPTPLKKIFHTRSPSSPNLHSVMYGQEKYKQQAVVGVSPRTGDWVPLYALECTPEESPLLKFHHIELPKDPYMSPLLATDHMLRKLPPVFLVSSHLDPVVDDSVSLAKRLKAINRPVKLDILDDLPHGFLNFVMISKEAKQGADLCIARIREVFGS
ncbi:hormone-sensitive lipase-like [Lingula anatina]|uniref:Hormone-sensitive lipase-like n=1 Tax=Lingula anatina TaxID=7574 RepID=A0A1S3I9U0_LINAN|nr:hormone-sensitive lipase-like [Lingula anatina]|eukprot:XP_013394169.1 hormone-sensitive lipase-like [Lingula anatina]